MHVHNPAQRACCACPTVQGLQLAAHANSLQLCIFDHGYIGTPEQSPPQI